MRQPRIRLAATGFAQKSEIRSTKSETNPKREIQSLKQVIDASDISDLEFRACFGFRYSDFEFLGTAAATFRGRGPVLSVASQPVHCVAAGRVLKLPLFRTATRAAAVMRDPFTWSFPIGQVAGIIVRLHILMPLILVGFVLREAFRKDAIPGAWSDALVLMLLLFFVILLHEFGHCFFARLVGGEAREVLLWPLGGLASVELPHTPSAHFLTALGGPLVNVVICVGSALALGFAFDPAWQPPWNALSWSPYRNFEQKITLVSWSGVAVTDAHGTAALLWARLFYVSWVTLLLNVVLIGFPLDGGRMLQATLWRWFGYRQSVLYAIFTGFGVMFFVVFVAIIVVEPLILLLAFFIYASCKQEWLVLETGGEESLFGYDFSQGYTSLEKDAPPAPRKKRQNFLQRWLQRRKQVKLQREQERQEAEERRMDELLQKIAQRGKQSLTDEENRFMKRVAERYRNRP
jgi:stage IV sporulation protein FB